MFCLGIRNLHPSVILGATVSNEAVTSPLAISNAVWPQSLVMAGPNAREGGFRMTPCAVTTATKDRREKSGENIVELTVLLIPVETEKVKGNECLGVDHGSSESK